MKSSVEVETPHTFLRNSDVADMDGLSQRQDSQLLSCNFIVTIQYNTIIYHQAFNTDHQKRSF